MNDKMIFGQYVNGNSWIHKLDPRTKIIVLIIMMVGIFLINQLYALIAIFILVLIIALSSKIPLKKFLDSFKMVAMLLVFTTAFQVLFNTEGPILEIEGIKLSQEFSLTVISLIIDIVLLTLFLLSTKLIKKGRILIFLLMLTLGFYIQTINDSSYIIVTYTISLHEEAFFSALKVLLRVITLISLSALLTLTTKPTDLNSGIEGIFAPFKFMRAQISIFAMMISIALRSIPTLINESQRILKAQASRGVDFNEGNLKSKINQIISLLVPMFVISYKKAEDLAFAMEARGYIPGRERTKLEVLKYKISDYLSYLFIILFLGIIVVGKIMKVI